MKKIDLKKMKMVARKNGETIHVKSIDSVLGEVDVIESRNNKDAGEDQVMSVIKSTISQLGETFKMYKDAGRMDEAVNYKLQQEFLQGLLPRQMSEDEMEAAVDKALSVIGIDSKGVMGSVINQLKSEYGASLNMGFVSKCIKERLKN